MARIDVPHLMAGLGGETVSIEETDGVLTIVVATPAGPTVIAIRDGAVLVETNDHILEGLRGWQALP